MASAGLAVVASLTHPFTGGAEAVTAVALGGVAVATAVVTVHRRRAGDLSPTATLSDRPGRGRSLAWVAVAVLIASFEAFSYLGTPRSAHPTLSTVLDLVDSTRPGKAAAFALWPALGWWLVLA